MRKRILPPTYFYAAVLLMVGLHVAAPLHRLVPWPWSLAGVLPVLIGIALNLWAARLFKRAGTTEKPFEESAALVTDGPFRFTRNPMYVGMVLILIGEGVLLGSASPFAVVPVFAVLMQVLFIRHEEQAMAAAFGDAWRAYRTRVRPWI